MTDWQAWSREAVALMQRRNEDWQTRFALRGAPFQWDLETATITFQTQQRSVHADLTVVGTISRAKETFLWGWANDFPKMALRDLNVIRDFGAANDLSLLTTPEWRGGRAELLEMLAVSGRLLDADGAFVDDMGDVTIAFVLRNFRQTLLTANDPD
jgi:hypothetical protein